MNILKGAPLTFRDGGASKIEGLYSSKCTCIEGCTMHFVMDMKGEIYCVEASDISNVREISPFQSSLTKYLERELGD